MTEQVEPNSAATALLGAEPMVFVTDFDAALAFYVGKLGFEVVFVYGDRPFYGQVRRDAAKLALRHVDTPVIDPQTRDREDLLSAAITVQDADALFAEFEAAGASFHQRPRTEPWGGCTFIVSDPDGNLILFAGSG